ncbi:helix-turn-helix domain-containing protein [Lentibacillus persicus]|uniref:helix-turn-helix domain-containing protein n=1 Tax=Lentibacillus persicus TaxID=640948 RepID=UPI0015A599E3|nr:helix-turn-helix transcriptional regulator [Lentibacillus persicus]
MEEIKRFRQLLGRQLRKTRQQYGLSIEDVAGHVDTGADHLGRIERGERQPTAYTFAKLCDYLGLDSHVLLEIMDELKQHRAD